MTLNVVASLHRALARVEVAARGGRSDLAREEVAVRTRSLSGTSMGPVEVPADTVCYTVSVHCSINECIHHVSIVLSMYLMSQCVRVRVYVYKYVCLCVYHRIYA